MALTHWHKPAEFQARKAERRAVKELQADLQTVVDAIDNTTTLAQLRGHVKDIARTLRRMLRLPNVSG